MTQRQLQPPKPTPAWLIRPNKDPTIVATDKTLQRELVNLANFRNFLDLVSFVDLLSLTGFIFFLGLNESPSRSECYNVKERAIPCS